MSERLRKMARTVFKKLDCHDLGRIDFRLSDAGVPYFLEINALPSLEPAPAFTPRPALEGLHFDGVIDAVIENAAQRYRIKDKRAQLVASRARRGPLKVGLHLQRQAHQAHRRR